MAFKAKKIWMSCQTVTNTCRLMLGLQDLQIPWEERNQQASSTREQEALRTEPGEDSKNSTVDGSVAPGAMAALIFRKQDHVQAV